MYDGRLGARFDYTLENMGPSIPSSEITVWCHFWRGKECPCFMPTRRPNRHLWATRRDGIYRGNRQWRCISPSTRLWNWWSWTSPWPRRNQSNRWRPWKWWSWLYWRWCRPQSARHWQPSKSPCKNRCEITASWQGSCTTGVQRNRRPQLTSPPRKWQSPPNGGHDQAVMPTTATTHKLCHKTSG